MIVRVELFIRQIPLLMLMAADENSAMTSLARGGIATANGTTGDDQQIEQDEAERLPKVVVFDLDGTVWMPEMYMLWGGGGSPFKVLENGNVSDRSGQEVKLMGNTRQVMHELHRDEKWKHTRIAFASSCDEPSWAEECIDKIVVCTGDNDETVTIRDVVSASVIGKRASKKMHFAEIRQQLVESHGIKYEFEDMIFFDNERHNCDRVNELGVTCVYVPDGMSEKAWDLALERFPSPGKIINPSGRGGRY